MISVGLIRPPDVHAPEIGALKSFLNAQTGFTAEDVDARRIDQLARFDLVYRLMGFVPRWDGPNGPPELHDYASLSTGRLPRVKNWVKRSFTRRPVVRSFLSTYVKDQLRFEDGVPSVIRDMGVPADFRSRRRCSIGLPEDREFDVVYVGALSGRRALGPMLARARDERLRVLLVGDPPNRLYREFRDARRFEFAGRVRHAEVPALCDRAWAGISHVPVQYPYGGQTATKVLEYCALGMPVITNRTPWVEAFQQATGAAFLVVEDWPHLTLRRMVDHQYVVPLQGVMTWDETFEESDLVGTIRRVLA